MSKLFQIFGFRLGWVGGPSTAEIDFVTLCGLAVRLCYDRFATKVRDEGRRTSKTEPAKNDFVMLGHLHLLCNVDLLQSNSTAHDEHHIKHGNATSYLHRCYHNAHDIQLCNMHNNFDTTTNHLQIQKLELTTLGTLLACLHRFINQ